MTPYADLTFNPENRQLLAAAFGLSMWTYDLGEPVSGTKNTAVSDLEFTCYPNPATDLVHIAFVTTTIETLHVLVKDLQGRLVADLGNSDCTPGSHLVTWKTEDVPSGSYVVSILNAESNSSRIVQVVKSITN